MNYKHGMSKTPEHKVWRRIIERCQCKTSHDFPLYGGRGIEVCQRWLDAFLSFYEDMGKRPSNKHQIDRIDNNKNYSPENCRWVLARANSQNRRTSRWWYVDGVRYGSCTEAGEAFGVSGAVIFYWCKGYVGNDYMPTRDGCYSELKYK